MIKLEEQVDKELTSLYFHDGSVYSLNFLFITNEISIIFQLYDEEVKKHLNHTFVFSSVSHLSITKFSIFDLGDLEIFDLNTEKIDELNMLMHIRLINCTNQGDDGFPTSCDISFQFKQFKRINHIIDSTLAL